MCNRYVAPAARDIETFWQLMPRQDFAMGSVFPRSQGPFIRAVQEGDVHAYELVRGQWGLIPHFAKEAKLAYSTNNARFEELAEKASYRDPWNRGQRCIIPAVSFDEPCWETGKNVWWRFRRSDGAVWGLAGLWNTWIDKSSGEIHESYTMLTINADDHPLMSRMHKPDPKYAPDDQDKRSVIPIEKEDVDRWLTGSIPVSQQLAHVSPVETFDAGPAEDPPTTNESTGKRTR